MRVTATIRYDAPPQQVYAMLVDPTFQDRKLRGTGALTWTVSVQPAEPAEPAGAAGDAGAAEPAGAVVRSSRDLPTDRVPQAFRAALGASLTLVQTETWGPLADDGARVGSLEVEVLGAPITLRGTVTLIPAGDGTEERVEGELRARLPIVGARVERAAEPALMAAVDVEQRVGREWLAEGR